MQAPLFDSCKGYIAALGNRPFAHQKKIFPSITLSREAGAGATTVGKKVLQLLHNDRDAIPWTLFDRNLVERIINDHALPVRLKEYLSEDRMGWVSSTLEEAIGLHPGESALMAHTADTILRLASIGNAVIIGRGGNFLTSRLHNVLHVRLVAPLPLRIRRVREIHNLTEREATLYVHHADRGRARYVRHYFHEDVSDPLHYHLVLNTGHLTDEDAAGIIALAAKALAE